MAINENIKISNSDIETLEKIYLFGGYTTTISLNQFIKKDISNIRRYLYKMVEGNYLKNIPLYSNSDREPAVYQVTAKTCRLFNNPNSYFRKKHNDTYIIRALIKQHFLLGLANEFFPYYVCDNKDRINILSNEIGIKEEFLPQKYNKGYNFTHVEEYMLDFRKRIHNNFRLHENIDIYSKDTKGIVFLYIDKFGANPSSQVLSLIKKYEYVRGYYEDMVSFLVVVDNEIREMQYLAAIKKHSKHFYTNEKVLEIPDHVISYHKKILEEQLLIAPESLIGFANEVRKKYCNNKMIIHQDFEKEIVERIRIDGFKAVENVTNDILNSDASIESKTERIKNFFNRVYRICISGKYQKNNLADVRICKIDYKFSP